MNTTPDPTCIAYLRVSTTEQGLSLTAQLDSITAWSARTGLSVRAVFTDSGVSGSTALDARPGLSSALAALKPGDTLAVAKRDRAHRSVAVSVALAARLASVGAQLASADGTGNGNSDSAALTSGIVDVIAQYELSLIRTRTRNALAVKRSRNERTGTIPLGFQLASDGRTLEPNPLEQASIARARALHATGDNSLRRIARTLTREGHTPRGAGWTANSVQRLLNANP